jgi:hypothetical protein
MSAGRPSLYTPELAAIICDRLSSGESLRQVCRDESMPCTSTVLKWVREIEEFSQQYAKARDALVEHWAEEIIEIADDGSNDWVQSQDENNPGYRVNGEHINRSRLRVDTRKWLLSKLAAKRYGDRISAEVSGPDGGPIETVELTPAEAARRIAFVLQSAFKH